MIKPIKKTLKTTAHLIGFLMIIGLIFYTWWVRPYLTNLQIGHISFSSQDISTRGFPFDTQLDIDAPTIFYNGIPFWTGQKLHVEWSLLKPTQLKIELRGQHILSAHIAPTIQARLQMNDTSGYIHFYSVRHVKMDLKAQKTVIHFPSFNHTPRPPVIAQDIALLYDGPTYDKENSYAGDLSFSAKNIVIPSYIRPPIPSPISQLGFKATYDQKNNSHIISNMVLFWDRFRAAGNGTLKYKPHNKNGDFIIAVDHFDALIRGLYKTGRITPTQLHLAMRTVRKSRDEQNRTNNKNLYLPAQYKDQTFTMAGIPVFKMVSEKQIVNKKKPEKILNMIKQ